MGFLSWKQECGICGKQCGLNRWKVSTDNSWLCPECFKKMGGIKNIDYLKQKTIDEIREIIEPTDSTEPEEEITNKTEIPIKSLNFKVAGVTFKTGRSSRQVMLKDMYFKNPPRFDEGIRISFKRYDFEGRLAIAVYANDYQIGNVPAKLTETFNSYWTSNYTATYSVYGGGEGRNWGCEIDVLFE